MINFCRVCEQNKEKMLECVYTVDMAIVDTYIVSKIEKNSIRWIIGLEKICENFIHNEPCNRYQ